MPVTPRFLRVTLAALFLWNGGLLAQNRQPVDRFGLFEASFEASGRYGNPYVEAEAYAIVARPDSLEWRVPLFWDGGNTWKLRVSPDAPGAWSFTVHSADRGLDGQSGSFECRLGGRRGSIVPMRGHPSHFQYQDGSPVWFLGDTAWGYFTDSDEDNHHRPQAEHYASTRAQQGFNAIHSMLLSEQGVGNNGGLPFDDIGAEKLNPSYWQEVDERLAYANRQGLVVGLALAWGDKRKAEPFAWRRFPDVAARKRYARYIAARYGAYEVYFLVSGEWHAEVRTRDNTTAETVMREFVAIGEALDAADAHGRMIGIHPMIRHGSVREFAGLSWMSFADYQQNYRDLHARVLLSRGLTGPVVNSEYGYHLRDSDGNGQPDKDNSLSAEDIRFASWDIVTAGGYLVTGFGTTYFGGHRDPGPFDVDAAKNDDWEAQAGHLLKFFTGLEWWRLVPADSLLTGETARGADRSQQVPNRGRELAVIRPPAVTYWAMAIPGDVYVIYARGVTGALRLELDARPGRFAVRQFSPRSGEARDLGVVAIDRAYEYTPPDGQDWAVVLRRTSGAE